MSRYGDGIASLAVPLTGAGDLDRLVERAAGCRVVMLGEASHGTHEFYRWRALVTRRLIEELGFSFVAVEGDWPDCARVDAAVRGLPGAPADPREALHAYDRWPTWMWANEECVDFARWLRDWNRTASAGFHGLDVYSLWESMRAILVYLREHDPAAVGEALAAYKCFEPFAEDPQAYAWATRFVGASCEPAVVELLTSMRTAGDLGVRQNAEIVAGAESYYRAMVQGGPRAWNVRDHHMDDTLARLLDHHGPGSKAVVWAHNTHVGDSRATDQAAHGEVTIGELARQRYGPGQVLLVGMGTHRGTVVAAPRWGDPMEVMGVPPARPGSLEDVLHATAPPRALFLLPEDLTEEVAHRAIGVVYRPERERWGNYVPTVLGKRYDAFLWFDETTAVRPLHPARVDTHELETYPSGV
ncbi:erythromycin esterase family protein [Actinoplanes sp. RD1]|uniref:erythromycin esterase family protein n=1 Tax=Actinoplanes sp. RD1 TaxID=3064538 RepID=UPI0027417262|nr:erythromycin esterase family protein [Actinoplanes sp. RD1]